jgi:hypothetical protein
MNADAASAGFAGKRLRSRDGRFGVGHIGAESRCACVRGFRFLFRRAYAHRGLSVFRAFPNHDSGGTGLQTATFRVFPLQIGCGCTIRNSLFNVARKLYANAPRWLRVASVSLLAYAALRSILSFGFSGTIIHDAKGLAVFSAFLAAFSALAATTLISYAGTEHPLRPDELRKAHPPL